MVQIVVLPVQIDSKRYRFAVIGGPRGTLFITGHWHLVVICASLSLVLKKIIPAVVVLPLCFFRFARFGFPIDPID